MHPLGRQSPLVTRGEYRSSGRHKDYLQSFELALRDAGVEECNLVTVSWILPPKCRRLSASEGAKLLEPGALTLLATTLGVDFDPTLAWDERELHYKMSGKILKTFNVTRSAQGDKDGR